VRSDEPTAGPLARCPRCGNATTWAGNPHRPFCKITCRLIDLGRWLDEGYRVAGDALPEELPRDDRPSRPIE